MINFHNKRMAELARKRRAMYYRLHIKNEITATDLARRFGISHQRMSFMLRQAAEEIKG